MYRTTIGFHNRLMQGKVPVPYIVIRTGHGYRAYAEKELVGVFDTAGYIADGTYSADGTITAGALSAGVLEKSARVISFGAFNRSLQPINSDILGGYQSKALQSLAVELENSDRHFSRLIAADPFIGMQIKYYVGFEDLPQSEHIKIFSGIINEITLMPKMTIEANEE